MRKNILAVLILAATLVNLTLTAVSLFVVVPTNTKTNNLIKKIVAMIDMDIENKSIKPGDTGEHVPINASVPIPLEDEIVVTLKSVEGDTKRHYLQLKATVSLNKEASDFKAVNDLVAARMDKVREIIIDTCSQYTVYDASESKEQIKQQVIEKLQAVFESQCIYDVTFSIFNIGE